MPHTWLLAAVIWMAYIGTVGTVASAGAGERAVGSVATGGVFAAAIATLLVLP